MENMRDEFSLEEDIHANFIERLPALIDAETDPVEKARLETYLEKHQQEIMNKKMIGTAMDNEQHL